ncbi:DUF2716 domain-containing protein [Streptomyces sp. NPDC050625]|uniref:DUF2716 domain-containing protein n=1 Tax=Streptomyces sp. NPDC050625 TaxID=3154629 RepID=UPI0034283CD6
MTATSALLWAGYESQIRGAAPPEGPWEPWGTWVERDGPLVRVHHGTHGTVVHASLVGADLDLDGLVRRQQAAFAERVEPVEWKVYDHDGPALPAALSAAGFTPGPPRALLIADVADVPACPGAVVRSHFAGQDEPRRESVRRMAADAPEQRRALAELEADGQNWEALVLEGAGRVVDVLWLEAVRDTDFTAIGGTTGPRPELLDAAVAFCSRWSVRSTRLVAEAPAAFVPAHLAAGFHEAARVTTYRWAPPGEPARERPSRRLLSEPEHDEIWKRFEERFEVTYETAYDGIAEPPGSVAFHMAAVDHPQDPLLAEVERVIARGLRACGRPGDRLYRLKWYISGSRCDPTRVGGPGQPRWVGCSYLVDENVVQVSGDLRMGTYGNFREESLCVFGPDLVAEVEAELTALLGTVLRRDGRPVGNVWSFGP